MTQLKKRTLISVLLCVFALAVGMFFSNYTTTSALATENIITAKDNITVTVGATGPSIDGTKTGIKLTNSTAGQKGSVTLSGFKGPFDLKFRPYSDPSTTDVNDFERLIFSFVNKIDPAESFDVRMEEVEGGTYSPVWYKTMKNEATLFRPTPSQTNASALNVLKNPNASFVNKSSGGFGDISRLTFDPYNMELSHYKGTTKTLLVDFDDPASMKSNYASYHTIPDMSEYDVVITLSPVSGKACNVMLYELNGESLGGQSIADAKGPSLDTRINMPTGVVGHEYKLDREAYKMFDLVDGYTKFNGTIRAIASGASYGDLTGDSFVPTVAGKHILKFTPVDSQGNKGSAVSMEFQVLAEHPQADWEFDYEVSDQLVINDCAKMPGARFYSPLAGKYDGVISVSANVLGANGTSIQTIDDASEPFVVSLAGNTSVTVVYSATDYIGKVFTEQFAINNNSVSLEIPSIDSAYVVGSYLYADNVPGTTHTITSPSGKISSYEKVLIDEVGLWTVVYSHANGSYVQYAEGVETVSSLWNTKLGLTVLDEVGETAAYSRTHKIGSIMNSSTPYSQAEFKNIINVSGYTKDDTLFEWFTVPKVMGTNEFKQITIYLDDLVDPSKSIRLEHYLYPYFYYEIMPTRVIVGDTMVEEYAPLYHTTFYGEWTRSGVEASQYNNTPVKISFDYENRDIVIGNDYYTQIVPLDNPETIGIGKEWTGFTNDELKLTVEFSIITGEANLMVRTVDNLSLTKDVVTDNVAPRVNVVYDSSNPPKALVGDAEHPFPLMPAYAVDAIDGIITDIDYSVKFLKDGRVYDFPASADGTILPTEEGTFRITYSATDLSGNIGSKTVEIQAYNTLDPLDIDIDVASVYPSQISVGEKIIVYPANGIGGSGNVNVEILAFDGDTQLDIDEVYVRPQAVTDDLKIVYRLTDYLGQTRDVEVPIKVVVYDGAVFSSIIVPPAVIANKPFAIPQLTAKQFNADGTSTDLDVTVLINGEAYNDAIYTTPNEEGQFTLQYVAGESSTEVYTIEVRNPIYETPGYLANFFYMSDSISINETPNTDEEDKRMIFNVVADGSIFFVNPQSSLATSVEFTLNKETNNIGKINFRYVSVENPEEQILLTVQKNPNAGITTGLVTVNDKATYTLPGDMTTVYDLGIRLGFNGNKLIGSNDQVITTITDTVDGASFNGFTGSKVYMFIEFVDVSADSEFRFISINKDQQFSIKNIADYRAPSLVMDRDIVTAEYGKKYTLPTMRVEDVLDSVVTGSMTITSPSGIKIAELTSIEEFSGYSFVPNEFGAYKVVIRCADSLDNIDEITENIRILDTNDIQIITQSAVPEVVRKGEQVTLPGLVNIPNGAQVFIYLLSPEGNKIVPGANRVFTAGEYGNYKLFYTVIAPSGVVSVESFTIKVR